MVKRVDVYFSLGSNLGDREANILEAVRRMDEAFGCRHAALSSLIETEPMGFSGGPFLNAAVLYRMLTEEMGGGARLRLRRPSRVNASPPPPISSAQHLLSVVKTIERAMGRTDQPEYDADGKRVYHSRIIDIDILFYGKERIDCADLQVPHPLIAERDFVKIPLAEIAKPSLKAAFPELFA